MLSAGVGGRYLLVFVISIAVSAARWPSGEGFPRQINGQQFRAQSGGTFIFNLLSD